MLIDLRRESLSSFEFNEQIETGLYVALQAVNLPVVEALLSLNPSLKEDLPGQFAGMAESGGWRELEKLTQSEILKKAFTGCRRQAAFSAIRQCSLHEFIWCEDMDAGSPLIGVGAVLNEVIQKGGYAFGRRIWMSWNAVIGFLSRPSIRAQAASFKDTVIRRCILEGNAEVLVSVQELTLDIVTAIRPSEFCRLFCERAAQAPHVADDTNWAQGVWNSLEAFSCMPFLRPCFLDSCQQMKRLAICQGRIDRFEWLEGLVTDERDFFLDQVFTSLDSLLERRDGTTMSYLLHRLKSIGRQGDAYHIWQGGALDCLLRNEDNDLLGGLYDLFLPDRHRVFAAAPHLFGAARVISALGCGKLTEAWWLLFMMGDRMIWSIADQRAFARNAALCIFDNERHRFWTCCDYRLYAIQEALED